MFLPTARKWRPQTFDEVVGQDDVIKALKTAIELNKIGQAYLFSGPRGVGKTTISRILAKSLNCINGPTPTPCNKCENCQEIKNGNSVDVIEIDGASNRKIDDIRNIREAVKFVPVKSRYKIYIIDEVHMLTDEAFNALLKTLEEPPKHVLFIFATTEPYKVKQTIRSRCQHFPLKPLSVNDILKQLKKISESENYKLPDRILTKIAKAGNGSMRDAESMFDMVVSYLGEDVFDETKMKAINEEDISKILGVIDISYIENFLLNLSNKNVSELIRIVNNLESKGFDLKKLVEEIITTFRNLLIIKEFGIDRTLLKALDDEINMLQKFQDKFSKENIIFIQNTLIKAYSEMKTSINELFHLENAIFRIVDPDNIITLSKLLDEVRKLKDKIQFRNTTETQPNSETSYKIKTNRIDPADNLIEEIDRISITTEEIIKQIISENSIPGIEKKIKIQQSQNSVKLIVNKSIKEMIEKELEKIISKIKSSTNIENIEIIEETTKEPPQTKQPNEKTPKNLSTEEKIMDLFSAKEIKSFTEH
ncbi:MAG: DNA polymerase III subunit gamma/tau [Brevinematia bacterium]